MHKDIPPCPIIIHIIHSVKPNYRVAGAQELRSLMASWPHGLMALVTSPVNSGLCGARKSFFKVKLLPRGINTTCPDRQTYCTCLCVLWLECRRACRTSTKWVTACFYQQSYSAVKCCTPYEKLESLCYLCPSFALGLAGRKAHSHKTLSRNIF